MFKGNRSYMKIYLVRFVRSILTKLDFLVENNVYEGLELCYFPVVIQSSIWLDVPRL